MSNIKEVSRYCLPEVEYLMISCRPHYLHYLYFRPPIIHTETNLKLSLALHLENLTIILALKAKIKAGSTSDSLNTEVVR
jgi:hypothetical protein